MARRSRRRRGTFLNRYRLDGSYLLRPDRKKGRPGIRSGFDEDGHPILIKVWPRTAETTDLDLREIWYHEVRQLHRLGGYPKAADTIAILQDAGEDESGFYLVLEPGQRRPLASILTHTSSGNWLNNQRLPHNRALLWRNLTRICSGLETLHTQGLLHKNLNTWAILATGSEEPDFQLTGFEWSVRLVGEAAGRSSLRRSNRSSGEPASFLKDWKDFGLLAAGLMNVPLQRLIDTKVSLSGVAEHMNVNEIRLLRHLIQIEHLDHLDGEVVERRIHDVLRTLEAQIANLDTKLHLVVRLGSNSALSQQIREASDNEIGIDSAQDQMDFIRDDLGGSPLLIGIKNDSHRDLRLALQGIKLVYRLSPFLPHRREAIPTWEFAYCDGCERRGPARKNVLGGITLDPNSLNILNFRDARQRFSRLRGRLRSWEMMRKEFEAATAVPERGKRLRQALALTQFLEALYAAADVFPVEVVGTEYETKDDMAVLRVRVRAETERDDLSVALGVKPPAIRFDEVLMSDRKEGDWILTESRHVGTSEPTDTQWRFESKTDSDGPPTYLFVGSNMPMQLRNLNLIPGDFPGRDIQFQRHIKAFRALADHVELLWMLVDPRRRILDTHDSIEGDDVLTELDDSKRNAMAAIVKTLPLYLVQGPPGVGKTRMVRELVRYTFRNEITARLLLTAQSNAAVDHLLETLHGVLGTNEENILIVRCRARDSNEISGPYEIEHQTRDIVHRFAQSPLIEEASQNLRDKVISLAADLSDQESGEESGTRSRYAKQAIEGLVVRSANVVFATTNSRELERLIDERGQFDWSIIEEAGKATGGELVSPLLLSYRRLMIGDHKQLSPFGSERVVQLLENPEAVIAALRTGQEFISRTLRDPSTDEILDEIDEDNQDGFAALCASAINCLFLFERLIEDEFALHVNKPTVRKIAHRLDQQHRMHPAIARLVSRCFYDRKLHTDPAASEHFLSSQCPVKSLDNKRLPDTPIVMIDMPYIQSTPNMTVAERHPRWHNPEELEAVVQAIKLLQSNSGAANAPSLAVLSPYSEQVRRLRSRIDEDISEFPNLADFQPAVGPQNYCGTVDSFQGKEADVVVVSLVRNNHHSGVRSALGFLSEFRRMNVLLSRAKWRLLLVCSSKFLENIIAGAQATNTSDDILFLSAILNNIKEEQEQGNACVVSLTQLAGGVGK